MKIEMFLSKNGFCQIIRDMILENRQCFSSTVNLNGHPYYLDHFEILQTDISHKETQANISLNKLVAGELEPLERTVSCHPLQIRQNTDIYFVSTEELEAAGPDPAQNYLIHSRLILLDVALEINNYGNTRLSIELDRVLDLDGNLDLAATLLLKDRVKAGIWFNIQSILRTAQADLPEGTQVVNAGIAASENLSRVGLRFDTTPNPLTTNDRLANWDSWNAFFNHGVPDLLYGEEWSILFPINLLTPRLQREIEPQLAASNEFRYSENLTFHWKPRGGSSGEAVIGIKFSGEAVDACLGMDVDVDVDIDLQFSVPQTNTLRTRMYIDWEVDSLLCAFVVGLIGLVTGGLLLGVGLSIVTGLTAFLTVFFLAEEAGSVPSSSAWVEVSEKEYYQDIEFPGEISGMIGGLFLEKVNGTPQGMIFSGSLQPFVKGIPELDIRDLEHFRYCYANWCEDLSEQVANGAVVYGQKSDVYYPNYAFEICRVAVLDDPLNVYRSHLRLTRDNRRLVAFSLPAPLPDSFWANPYPCKVLMLSLNGARILTLNPPPPELLETEENMTEEELLLFNADRIKKCVISRFKLGHIGIFLPDWLIDPLPFETVSQLWIVEVGGLRPGEFISIGMLEGQEFMRAVADQTGVVHLNAIVTPELQAGDLYLSLNGTMISKEAYLEQSARLETPGKEPRLELKIQQVQLIQRAVVALDTPAEQISIRLQNETPVLVVETVNGRENFDLADIAQVSRLAGNEAFRSTSQVAEAIGTVPSVASVPRRLNTALAEKAPVAKQPAEVEESMRFQASNRQKLLTASAGRLKVFDLARTEGTSPESTIDFERIVSLEPIQLAYKGPAVFVRTGPTSGITLDIGREQPGIAARHWQLPFQIGSARYKNTFARLSEEKDLIRIYRIGQQRELPPFEKVGSDKGR